MDMVPLETSAHIKYKEVQLLRITQLQTLQRANKFCIVTSNWLSMFKDIIAIYCENCMKKLIHPVLKVQTYFYIKVDGPYSNHCT